jgi:hypothetical protein
LRVRKRRTERLIATPSADGAAIVPGALLARGTRRPRERCSHPSGEAETVQVRIEEWSDEGDPPGDQDSYYRWDVFITVEARTYYARRVQGHVCLRAALDS